MKNRPKKTAQEMIDNLVNGYLKAAHADPELVARVKLFLDLPEHLRWALLFWGVRTACKGLGEDVNLIATAVLNRLDEASIIVESSMATKQ